VDEGGIVRRGFGETSKPPDAMACN
jgi:hypothetical protein